MQVLHGQGVDGVEVRTTVPAATSDRLDRFPARRTDLGVAPCCQLLRRLFFFVRRWSLYASICCTAANFRPAFVMMVLFAGRTANNGLVCTDRRLANRTLDADITRRQRGEGQHLIGRCQHNWIVAFRAPKRSSGTLRGHAHAGTAVALDNGVV